MTSITCPKCGTVITRKKRPKEEEGVRRGRETAEYLKSRGYMGGKKRKEGNEH